MMPFQHVAVPQDEKPQLYHWLRFASLACSFSSAVSSLAFFFARLGFKKTKMGEKRERWRRRKRDSGELKKLGGGGFKLDSKLGMEWVWVRVAMWALLFLGPPHTPVNEKKMSEQRRMGHSHETSGLLYTHKHRQNLNRTFYAIP